ncbi:maleylpyruvate isomerase family mycothiol-dependent enzyme [Ornithinimicrobium sediminis]|uniref:maleylpyruvate isomerase family mycothiol-dependent enzyme n=1 Tax=Ornithinimicrobium sediminis TaxID=2904603 RepID=UPI001E56D9E1|nr:maleylpyruvate isomerase family mycothiol-dependent enzyme [Ornithinimicrobium sediminis]
MTGRDRTAVWEAVHDERRLLVGDLEGLTGEQWSTGSLCPGWSVHDALAHLVDSATTTRVGFVRQMVSARFDFDRANDQGVRRHRASDPQQTLAAFRAVTRRTDTPPASPATRLVEAYVHGEDIRRPLGIAATYPSEHVMTALSYLARTGAGIGGGRERVHGLRLCPSDVDQHIGEGPAVRGSAIALLLATSGRPCGVGELTGPGAEVLAARS